MSNYNQKKQKVNNQVNAENVEQEIENTGKMSQEINAQKVQIGTKPVICPKCKTSNKTSSKFCKKCGQSLTKLCKTCWTENDLTTVFCVTCGVEVDKSKFGISPELAQKWKEKFASLGWQTGEVREKTRAILERMGQPFDSREIVILDAGVIGDSSICKLSVGGKEVSADPIFKEKCTGGIKLTSQRILVTNYVDGLVASYPHEYLIDLSTSQEKMLGGKTVFIFSLDYGTFGTINIHKIIPGLYQRSFFERLTSSDSFNARMDLQTTMINTVIARRIQDTHDENAVFMNFFQSIIELQRSFHQNTQGFTPGLSSGQFIQDAPEIKLPPEKDPCAPKAAAMLMILIAMVSLVTHWLF